MVDLCRQSLCQSIKSIMKSEFTANVNQMCLYLLKIESSRRKTYSKLKRKLQEIDQSNIEDCIEVWQPENPLIYGLEDRDHIMESSDIVNTPPLKVEMDHSSNEVIIDSHSIKDEPNRFSKAYSSLSSSQVTTTLSYRFSCC